MDLEPRMNVRTFRQNLKKHLDNAEQGKIIIIERGNTHFQLTADNYTPKISTVLPQRDVIPKSKFRENPEPISKSLSARKKK